MMAAEGPDALTLTALHARLPDGWTREMVRQAVREWQSLSALIFDEDTGRIQMLISLPSAAPTQRTEEAPMWAPVAPPPGGDGPRAVALLSLFAGMGTDRVAMDRLLAAQGLEDRLGPSWFVEADGPLRAAVSRHWEQARIDHPSTAPYSPIAEDVWQLVDPSHPAAHQLAGAIPQGTLLLIVAGSPCQGLTAGGPLRGRAGVASAASCAITAVFAVWHVLRSLRPDLEMHVVLENAGSMRPEFRQWILDALGIGPAAAPTTDAAAWSGFGRRRTFFSTLPAAAAPLIPVRPPPWDEGWGRRHLSALPPMQRSRGPLMRASTYQYQAAHLVYRRDQEWHFIPEVRLFHEVRRRLPPELIPSWQCLALNLAGREQEREAEPVAVWLAEHGHSIGARTPNLAERARAADLYDFCQSLLRCGLSREALFDAQGNAFDVDAFRARVQAPVLGWLLGTPLPPAILMAPDALGRHYDQIVARVAGQADLGFAAVALTPGPDWLWHNFTHFCGPGGRPAE